MMRGQWKEKWQDFFNPCHWQMRMLGLKLCEEEKGRRGLVLIQIDGLSHPDLQRALKRRHMPFLSRLIKTEHYEMRPMFSGIPSNTPAFQGELFFGQHPCVPAFQFLDKKKESVFTMFEKNSAGEIEKRLMERDPGLIAGGSSYANIFSGGAAESHICASTADLGNSAKAWNPYSLLISFIFNPYAMVRGVVLCAGEILLAFVDFIRGFVKGQDFLMELLFILTRVLSSILIRDVATAHAQMDIYRGVPVVHVNYFGYDEQAHRRGPSTRFAYWSLSGIDKSIRRIWNQAAKARARHYDVWVYSDHGQEKVTPFTNLSGCSVSQAVRETFEEFMGGEKTVFKNGEKNESWGDTVMGTPRAQAGRKKREENKPLVTTLGPIAQVYFPAPLSDNQKKDFARKLLEKYPMLPLAVVPLLNGTAEYHKNGQVYRLPEDKKEILGAEHPYLEETSADLEKLMRHESRGDVVIFGWSAGKESISFSNENGAHAGLGPRETQAFTLLPADAPLQKTSGTMRAIDLREAALILMKKVKPASKVRQSSQARGPSVLRVLSYNAHSCLGTDGILSPERIARVIAKSDPDIVALQELDAGRRIKGADQAAAIARELEMHFHFHPVCGGELQCFGNAILSRYPLTLVRAERLPTLSHSQFLEPRGILWAEVQFQGKPVHILNTHLSLWAPELKLQLQKLLGPELLGHPELARDVILCGDLNITPDSKFFKTLSHHLKTPDAEGKSPQNLNTWTSQWPLRRLDHILMRGDLKGKILTLPRTRLESSASDHLPIAADFEF